MLQSRSREQSDANAPMLRTDTEAQHRAQTGGARLATCALCAQAKRQHTDNLELLLSESLLRHEFGALPHILLALLANQAS